MNRKSLLILATVALLAACGDDEPVPDAATEEGGEATGEVLGGTISDDMIPLDQLTSTSPPAEPTASSDGGGASSGGSASTSTPDPTPEPESEEAEPAAADPAPPVAGPLEE
ncbi:hypothetical protein [Erythrobacter crassostreae]|uniref:Uncharacterized protein n=1 Tax=Erythrobacter crassostreae TaxID=2828328 RepID=A0A9X1F323_9SPHN|nr:hypothetical protein [Erythrobacter crassostrea]MBV7259127.1 hypothetical protein [Erythrobacter crassostrea]